MSTNLPEFTVTLKMARSTGPLADEVEHRTFTVSGPARHAKAAEAIAFGLGHGINEASGYAWKFCGGSDSITVQTANETRAELDKLRAQVADLADKLHKANADNASLTKAGTAWANEVAAKDAVVKAAKEWAKSSVAGIENRPHEEALYAAVQSLPKAQAGEAVYLIWSNHHHYWFAPNGCGYRSNPADAGRYSLADAQKWLGRGCGCCRVPEVLVRADVVSGAGDRTIRGAIAEATRAAIESGQVNRCYEPVAGVA